MRQRRGDLSGDDLAVDALHDVEGRADDLLVLAGREHARDPRPGRPEGAQQARLAQHVVGALGNRRARRAAQHDLGVAAAHEVGDVGVAVADGLGGQVAAPDPVLVEEALERLDDEQRRPLVGRRLGVACDDVVRRGRDGHARQRTVGTARGTATLGGARRF